ncbi:MAG: hypothetical protein K2K45_11350 [Muribaculaceae bacterium]|nr:hypothetical protein [Muribaculaceae bacterium]
MKKSLLFAAAIATAFAANAEVFEYGFNYDSPAFPFLGLLNNEDSEYYFPGNYELVDKYGVAMPNTLAIPVLNRPAEGEKGLPDLGVGISMLDGGIYTVSADPYIGNEDYEIEAMPEENFGYPFLSWGESGMTRTLFMTGWGSEEAWEDKDYDAATEADWVSTKNGVQFTRLGTLDMVSRQDTYFQYPAVTGDVTVTVWAGTNLGGTANPNDMLNVIVTPVFDGVADPEQAVEISKESPANKRYYKLDPVQFDAKGKKLEVRVGCNGALLNLMHVRIEGDAVGAGVNGVAVDSANGVAYNLLGVQVDENYKGLVIKNGKKFVQK